ncbi:phosphomannomutase/phosphoglucomutase [Agrococcus sp. KRD186]|jgi:phosphomannomutase|uniref:phosphomannomutase/phosphoglucomutase n=1 Tax=Agrococcus sp. KRD186 TaxID=2729730 RepID=UPI0019D0AF2A|nr:phosphomannomutase/phosphoglucomutase [Agrococcus sp. KRD186]
MSLSDIVKAYDVRGLVDGQLTEDVVRALGAAFADEVGTESPIVIGHDMRPSSPALAAAAADGAQARGADVVLIGLCSTDGTYFASGTLDAPAMMFTASHNPASYNGIKFSRAGARGVSLDTGLATIRDGAQRYIDEGLKQVATPGTLTERDVLGDYAAYLRELVDLRGFRPLKVVVDAANGMGGMTVPAVLGTAAGLPALPLEIVPMYFELDGTFPNHEANPLDPANLVDLQAAVVEHGADIGLAFDGDADRCFVIDERGGAVSPSAVAAIVAEREIRRVQAEGERDVVVIHNLITSRVVPEVIADAGASPVRTRVGHSLIKDEMARTGAVFGGEHSAHYYFRDFWGADNGMLAAMHVLATLGADAEPMSSLAARYTPYFASGEINSTVADVPAAYTRIVEAFAGRGEFDELDGLTVTEPGGAWWFSVRPSNTEPLLRLNAEAETDATMIAIRDEVLQLIRG